MATLSALGVLELTEQKRVARIDLAEAGYEGVVFACDLTATEQQTLMAPKGGKMRVYKDQSMDVDMSALATDVGGKFLMACLVTDSQDGAILERAFAATEEPFIVIGKRELVWLADIWKAELKSEREVAKRLEQMPSAVTQLIIKVVRQISGVGDAAVEEKKDS